MIEYNLLKDKQMTPLKERLKRYCLLKFEYEKYKIYGKQKKYSIDHYTQTGRFSHSVRYDLRYEQIEPIVNKFIEENKNDFVKL